MKILWISDFFSHNMRIPGGAEKVDEILMSSILKKHDIRKISSGQISKSDLSYDFYIVSNFINLQEDIKSELQKLRYIIIEHDHKYLKSRNPSVYKNKIAPPSEIINSSFYRNAEAVFCQSKGHAEILIKNLNLENVINFGCSFWSEKEIDVLSQNIKAEKKKEFGYLNSDNIIKGSLKSKRYCDKNGYNAFVIQSASFDKLISQLSKVEKFVFFPQVYETFCRLAVEARVVGCTLITNNNLGCFSEEDIKNKKGADLLKYIKKKQKSNLKKLFSVIEGKTHQYFVKNKNNIGDITVILNSYRRPYNLQMQVDAIRKQTVKPKEIWLWVNHHEDNEGFDYSSLGVDKIIQNDFNWKFYGRFAAALLSDTEYIAIFDDDTIPGSKWFENCLDTMEVSEGIMGSAGVILDDKYYVRHERSGWATQNPETAEVDLVGHAWFFKRDWLQYLWREKPPTWDNGEDIHFSYAAQKYGGIKTYCPPHPPEDRELHGSIMGNELGIDDKATSNNNETSHQQFFNERDFCVQEALRKGWQTVRGVKL
jgi:hypothetical protein